jgi:hypothetical protein
MNDRPDFISEASNQEFHIDEVALTSRACPIREVARRLHNPRGIEQLPDGSLLVAEAGTGMRSDGRVVRLEPCSNGYQFGDVLLDGLPSVSMLPEAKREEILGAAEIHRVGSTILAMVIDKRGGVSRLVEIFPDGHFVRQELPGNVDDFVYDPVTEKYYAVSPGEHGIHEFVGEGPSKVKITLPKLAGGQDPVPCAICRDGWSDCLLVTLLSGEVDADRVDGEFHPISTTGLNFLHGVARILAFDPTDGSTRPHVSGLTFATNALAHGPHLFVLEGCNAFLDPLLKEEHLHEPRHGGFRRFSGRMLHIDRRNGQISVVADRLDLPSNLHLTRSGKLLVSQGAGIAGRPIPGPNDQTVLLEGFISELDVQPLLAH